MAGTGDGGEDPWGFLGDRRRAADATAGSPGGIDRATPARSLHRRAWPVALSLALVLFAGFVTEMVGASQMLALAGPQSLLVMYPVGGVGLLLMALVAFRVVDRRARLPMLRGVLAAYGVVIAVMLGLLLSGVVPLLATAVVWALADQLMFLVPGLLWSLAGDEFNAAEGRRVFGWIVSWTYAGQVAGLAVATVSPWALTALSVPLPALLVVDPVICLGLALWLPRAMAGAAAGRGLTHDEGLRASLASGWSFVRGVPVWQWLMVGSVLVYVAVMTVHLSFMAGAELVLGSDPATLQSVLAGVSLAGFCACWLIQLAAAERVQARLGIAGTLLVLPVCTVVAGALLAAGGVTGSILLLALGVSAVRVPKWSLDENARRAALALVPDERRARVSFLVDLAPTGVGLVLSGAVAAVAVVTGALWVAPALAAVVALAALVPMLAVRRGWDDSLLNWRLRRRKSRTGLDLG